MRGSAASAVPKPLRGSMRPRNRSRGPCVSASMGRRPFGRKNSTSTPFGMMSQWARKYREFAATTGSLTAIVAACRSRIFWSGRRNTRQPSERANHEWKVATTGMPTCQAQRLEMAPQSPTGGDARDATVRIDHPARPHPAHERRIRVGAHVGCDDGGGVPPAVELEGEVVNVLGDTPELGIVVFGDERDAHSGPAS